MKESKKYYIFAENEKVYVSEFVYKEYWKLTNRENYLRRLDRKFNVRHLSEIGYGDYCKLEDRIPDEAMDVENIIIVKEQIEKLYEAIKNLSPEEAEIINQLFFEDRTQQEVASRLGVNQSTVHRKKDKALKKLGELLKELK